MSLQDLVTMYSYIKHLKPDTLRNYVSIVNQFTQCIQCHVLDDITEDHFILFRQAVLSRASKTTWNTYFRHLRALFKFAIKRQIIESNPLADITTIPVWSTPPKTIEIERIHRFINYLESDESIYQPGWFFSTIVRTFFYTGMRRAQLSGLQWSDIDFKQHTILLKRSTSKTDREWVIPINQELEPHLQKLYLNTLLSLSPIKDISNKQVFRIELFNRKYQPLTPERISQWFNNTKRDIGEDNCVSAHKLRHTFATTLANLNNESGLTT